MVGNDSNAPLDVWKEAKKILAGQLPKDIFERWISVIGSGQTTGENIFSLTVANDFYEMWLGENYGPLIKEVVSKLVGREMKINFSVDPNISISSPAGEIQDFQKEITRQLRERPLFNPRYTFENFVTTSETKYAFDVALAFAEGNTLVGRSLLIHGGPGLGKSHLLHAIGQSVYGQPTQNKIFLSSAEGFLNSYIEAIKRFELPAFRKKIRSASLILLDDLQFMAKGEKEHSVMELLNTLIDLESRGGRIVFASNDLPYQMTSFPNTLISRLDSANLIRILPPGYDSKLSILDKKLDPSIRDLVPKEVKQIIAERCPGDVRSLEGLAIGATSAYSLGGARTAEDFLSFMKFPLRESTRLGFEDLLEYVACKTEVTSTSIKGTSRIEPISWARHLTSYLAHEILRLPYTEIARQLGKKHGAVMNSCEQVVKKMGENSEYRTKVDTYLFELRGK